MGRPSLRSRNDRIPNTRLKRVLAVILVSLQRSRKRSMFYFAFLKRLLDGVLAFLLRYKPAVAMAAVAAATVNLPPPLFAASVSFGPQQVISNAADRANSRLCRGRGRGWGHRRALGFP